METHSRRTPSEEAVDRLLRAARRHMGLEIAFISQFVGNERVFRFVDHDAPDSPVEVGGSGRREDSYCHYVAEGTLAQYLPDASADPVASTLEITSTLPVGTHVSVPIRLSDGRVYGTFCCFSRRVKTEFTPDLKAMRVLADVVAEVLSELERRADEKAQRRRSMEQIIQADDALELHFQPLVDLKTMQLVGVEVLSRFPGHQLGPQEMFAQAHRVGVGVELEMRVVRDALALLSQIPDPIRLNINVSPSTLVAPNLFVALADGPRDRVVLEVTEHAVVADYVELREASRRLTELGVWLAIDDVGMGFSGLNQVLEIQPDELKLDRVVIRNVDSDVVRQALVEGLSSFAAKVGVRLLAEGIETSEELAAVRRLGAHIGQGYYLSRPAPLAVALARRDFSIL
ncbi:MAG: EAL domain-containing protein [Actinobacteria bacterium]|nr:EAL domain-containing protein [Actinomycetota bacterium]